MHLEKNWFQLLNHMPFLIYLLSSPEIAIHKIYRYGKKRKSRL